MGDGTAPPAGPEGLTSDEARARLDRFGFNELAEKKVNICLKFLSYFWGPMPIMIWIAILVEFLNADWPDFGVLLFLQIVNGCVGFYEELNAGNAVAALKESLAAKANVKRDNVFKIIDARELVPGDLINIKLGDIVPADVKLMEDGGEMEVDQAALTGESLPITAYPGDSLKMGSTIKRGENEAHVEYTGANTFFGKAASMVNSVEQKGRFQIVLFRVTMFLLLVAALAVAVILVYLLVNGVEPLTAVGICVVLLVASIPIAMQVVSTSTMAVGSRRLAEKKVIVAKLSAIEEMAGMNMLCSDKTGTLTLNKLRLFDPILIGDCAADELIFMSALAAKRIAEGQDAIDFCLTQAVKNQARFDDYTEENFLPFDPVIKRTEATVRNKKTGKVFKTTKGAPQVILAMAHNFTEIEARVSAAVQDLADRGYRSLGVATTDDQGRWVFLGVLSLFDPPREDTADTIRMALSMGIEVKMITGDQTAIAKETSRSLGMGTNILGTEVLDKTEGPVPGHGGRSLKEIVREADGFAEVFPEHKFQIVEILMNQGFTCGMTGDGVNDAPALKRAHIGIAVEGATDAAQAAADIVLTEPGLSVIIDAVLRARKIFARVRNYCIYRISATLCLVFFFFFAVLIFKVEDYFTEAQRQVQTTGHLWDDRTSTQIERVFTLPVIALVLITILNDGTIITIARDKVIPASKPQNWNLPEVYSVSCALGSTLVIETLLLLLMGLNTGNLHYGHGSNFAQNHDGTPCGAYPATTGNGINLNQDYCDFASLVDSPATGGAPSITKADWNEAQEGGQTYVDNILKSQCKYWHQDSQRTASSTPNRINGGCYGMCSVYLASSHKVSCTNTANKFWGDPAYGNILSYDQLKTLVYMGLSISAFMTVYAARTRGAFFERRPGYALLAAFLVATGFTTVFAGVVKGKQLGMEHLTGQQIGWCWLYVIVWFLIQDLIFKRVIYMVYDRYHHETTAADEAAMVAKKLASTNLESERRDARFTAGGSGRDGRMHSITSASGTLGPHSLGGGGSSALVTKVNEIETKVNKMEQEIVQIKAKMH